ncbi:hypothetical protein K469DRAFT_724119 [Zopfia rhizophila CBS 207.26]|uniref:Uncharacterized protein n=1 Tax=Zopfia rhizophila CBS 207.26 TaxID=1314779 RepID=A0A6A6DAG5_9PEZI|nr:hypothetical protein K469DRAFT_724119 [Zopfia rhizophila CBS 207.26]
MPTSAYRSRAVSSRHQPGSKRARTAVRRERSDEEQMEDLASVLRSLDEDFAEKERLSREQEWCVPVPHARKVSTVQEFYKAFHDARTLPIYTCMICYRKCAKAELEEIDWDRWAKCPVVKRDDSPFACRQCFPPGEKIPGCLDCVRHLGRGALCPAAQLHVRLGCEHMFPEELKGLTLVEEKLIALNSCYGFITKHSIQDGHRQGVTYPRHVKGHVTVFPNNVQELVTNVLPHPLLKVMDEIHVSWQGREKPAPSDLAALLSVHRRVVERALFWLKRHNPLYAGVGATPYGVPCQIYDRLKRNKPSAREKIQTAHIVPSTERGLENPGVVDIQELLASLEREQGFCREAVAGESTSADDGADVHNSAGDQVYEINSSSMFGLDYRPDIADAEKLRIWAGSAEVRHGGATEPYILISRGEEFADSFDTHFFVKTFPTLFPHGKGGPRQAEEFIMNGEGNGPSGVETEADARSLVLSQNMNLETWAKLVVQRHGGRFATHPVFPFLVFNMGVRSRNRRVSMASVKKKDFPEVERIVRSLNAARLENAKAELEAYRKTTDKEVNQLLRSLLLYGYRQPMSRENRLTMRRKIKSLIVRYGIPAIWFTLNLNDIMNPVKLRLAAYRTRDADEAEDFLRSLDQLYKRARLAVSDPLSSVIFFHREISMFFKYYVRIREDSVFGRISQYYGAVETNERGALHLHGLLWFQGNMHLSSLLADNKVIEFIDSIFTEDLNKEAFTAVRRERPVASDIYSLLEKNEQFSAAFDEEANFCAGATQIHNHSPTCTSFTEDGVLQIRRSHSLVNRWNKAIAVGLRHNHDICFIMTKCKGLALVFYITNYATKVEDPVWKRVAAAKELFHILEDGMTRNQPHGGSRLAESDGRGNRTRQFLIRVANRIFTEQALSQVEVVAYLQGHGTEFISNTGVESLDREREETILLEETGQRISFVRAYAHRGKLLKDLSLYNYMSIVMLKRKGNSSVAWREVEFDSAWPFSKTWVQTLRQPGKHAAVCLDGYLSMNFTKDDENYHRRAAVQHLAMFVPWQAFLCETVGDINDIWERKRLGLPRRISLFADNIQLLRRTAEDVKYDVKQWAAWSGESDLTAERDDVQRTGYRSDSISNAIRLINVLRNAITSKEITVRSKEILRMLGQLYQFQVSALSSEDKLSVTIVIEQGKRTLSILGEPGSASEIPAQEQLRYLDNRRTAHNAALYSNPNSFREQEAHLISADSGSLTGAIDPSVIIQFGPSTSFSEAGRQLAESFTLNQRQSIALRLICRQLDRIRHNKVGTPQFCQFISGEGGTGKSQIIAAIAELFARMGQSHRLLITATSGTAAASINRITIHSACNMLGARTLYAVDKQLYRFQECSQDFGGIPIILFCGDFHQFRPDEERSFTAEQRHQHDKAHDLWKKFTTVVILNEQVRAAGDPRLQQLLTRVRQGITVVTPLNRNRWNLNVEATLSFQRERHAQLRIFISEHKWTSGEPTEEEALMILSQGDDSAIPVPAIFMFVPGMPVVVNENTHQGLKLVNGASYVAVDVILDKAYPGHRINADTVLHFGPPAGILLTSESTKDLHFVGMPSGTILLMPMSIKIDCQRKRP